MIFDKNAERLKELARVLSQDPVNQTVQERIERIRAAGPEWWIGYYDTRGIRRRERSPQNTKAGAEKYERQRRAAVERGEYDARDVRHVRMSVVIDAYLNEHMVQKNSYHAAKSLGGYVKKHIGQMWLDRIDAVPQLIVDHFQQFPEPTWSEKYVYNYFLFLRAAINHWIRFRRLIMKNPCDLVQLDPGTRVMEYVPTKADFEALYMASLTAGLPDWIRHLLTAVYESGLRINEIMHWQVEDIVLSPETGLPYYFAWISKQKRRMRKAIPMSKQLHDALVEQIAGRTSGPVWPIKNPPYKIIDRIEQSDGTIKTLVQLAGVQFERPFHDFRKTAKLRMKRMGLGKEVTKAMQGHATDSMDDYYTHFGREDLEAAVLPSWTPNSHPDKEKGDQNREF